MHNVLEEQQQRDEEGVFKKPFSDHKVVSDFKTQLRRLRTDNQICGGEDLLGSVVGERLQEGQARARLIVVIASSKWSFDDYACFSFIVLRRSIASSSH